MSDPSEASSEASDRRDADETDERVRADEGASDADSTPTSTAPALEPADAFSLLGDATRLEIVTTLYERDAPLPFSELYDALDLEDTGRFNYHAQQLVPHFVAKDDDGYELTPAGWRIARAVSAGTYTDSPRVAPVEIDGECHDCGAAALWAAYEDEQFVVECRACERTLLSVSAPPSLARGRDPEAVVDAFDRWSWLQAYQEIRGLCSTCAGPVEPTIEEVDDECVPVGVLARYECVVCGREAAVSIGGVAAQAPTVRAFHRERCDSPRDRPYWEVEQFVTDEHLTIESRDPWRVRVAFAADGDACHVTLDGDLEVVEATVVPGGADGD